MVSGHGQVLRFRGRRTILWSLWKDEDLAAHPLVAHLARRRRPCLAFR
jgi:hypothetical protein